MLDLIVIGNLSAVYTPQPTGDRTIVLGGSRILGTLPADVNAQTWAEQHGATFLDATGLIATPGFIDVHVHVAGGGGEAGPGSSTPAAKLSEILSGGTTTVVGTLGTDGISRSMESLITACRGLQADGISVYFWGGGGYRIPVQTVTGSVQRDIMLLQGCVGVGEIAISDHRSSQPTIQELARLASDARVGGMLAGSAGIVHCHVGPGKARLQPLRDVLEFSQGDIPISQFLPTHVNRSSELIEEAVAWVQDGGWADVTCSEDSQQTVHEIINSFGIPHNRLTVSTDAYGSLPVFDEYGKLCRYTYAKPDTLLRFVRAAHLGTAVNETRFPLEDVLPLVTSNPASLLGLTSKGRLIAAADADVLLLDEATLSPQYVFALGELLLTPDWVRGGIFESGSGVRPRVPC